MVALQVPHYHRILTVRSKQSRINLLHMTHESKSVVTFERQLLVRDLGMEPAVDCLFVELLIAWHSFLLEQNCNMQSDYKWSEVRAPGDLIWKGR